MPGLDDGRTQLLRDISAVPMARSISEHEPVPGPDTYVVDFQPSHQAPLTAHLDYRAVSSAVASTLRAVASVPFGSRPIAHYKISDGWAVNFHQGLGPNPVFLTPYNNLSGFDVDEFFAYGHADQLLAAASVDQAIIPRLIGLVGWIRSVGDDLNVPQVRLVEARTAAPTAPAAPVVVITTAAAVSYGSALSLHVSASTGHSTAIRCSYCLDDVAAGENSWTCPSCHVILHAECRAEVPRCFTLGCGGLSGQAVAPATAPEVESPRPERHRATFSLWPSEDTIAVFLFIAFVVALIFLAITSR